jgi:hypothetical protein
MLVGRPERSRGVVVWGGAARWPPARGRVRLGLWDELVAGRPGMGLGPDTPGAVQTPAVLVVGQGAGHAPAGLRRRGPRLPRPCFLVTTALDRAAAQVVEGWAARCRQEDGSRDHTQRLGLEACRAWTKEPVLRTFQGQRAALTLLRLLHVRLGQTGGAGSGWLKPAWHTQKRQASIRDRCRLFWRHRAGFSQLLVALADMEKAPQALARPRTSMSRAA